MSERVEGPVPPAVEKEKSGRPSVSWDAHEKAMLEFREYVREQAFRTQASHPEYENLPIYRQLISGEHWTKKLPEWRSQLTVNKIAQARIAALARLTDIKPTIEVTSQSRLPELEKQAEILKNIIQAEWIRQMLIKQLISVVDHALMATGYWKIGAVKPGRLIVNSYGIENVLPIAYTGSLQTCPGILFRCYVPITYFYRRWPDKAERIRRYAISQELGDKPIGVDDASWKGLNRSLKQMMIEAQRRKMALSSKGSEPTADTAPSSVVPMVLLEEIWLDDYTSNPYSQPVIVRDPRLSLDEHNYWYRVLPGDRLFPGKRLIVFAGDVLLYDGPNCYWHWQYPFAELNLNPVPWGYGSLSRYRDLIPINRAVNEIISGVMDMIKRAVNPQLIVKEGAVRLPVWRQYTGDKPGERLMLTPRSDPYRDIRWADPPNIPAYVMVMLGQFLMPEFDRIAGLIDIGTLQSKRQVPGGDTIEQIREALGDRQRLEAIYLEQFLVEAGNLAISNIFQFYTAPQRMRILGPDGITMQDFDYDPDTLKPWTDPPRDHAANFSFTVSQGTLHSSSRERNAVMAMALFDRGLISAAHALRMMGIQNASEILKERLAELEALGSVAQSNASSRVRMTRGQRTGRPV